MQRPTQLFYNSQNYPIFSLRGTMSESSISASVFTITVFTMERYLAVCHPFVARRRSGLFRASLVLPLIWLLALILGLVWGLQVHILHHHISNSETRCGTRLGLLVVRAELGAEVLRANAADMRPPRPHCRQTEEIRGQEGERSRGQK